MKYSVLVVFTFAAVLACNALAAIPEANMPGEKIRIACIGDSVTFGDGLKQRAQAYPGQLQVLLGDGYDVRNFGVNSMAVLKKADFSYFNTKAYKEALAFNPNIVISQFGGNDSKEQNWPHKADFLGDYKELLDSFKALPTKPRIIINTTSPAFMNKWTITDDRILNEVIPLVRQTAFDEGLEVIDIHTALIGMGDEFPDKMHPGPEACKYIAKVVQGVLLFKDDPDFNIEKTLAEKQIAVKVSNFYGFRQLDFTLADGRKATIVRPYRVAAGRPFALCAGAFGEAPLTDVGLLQRGYHIVWFDKPAAGDNIHGWNAGPAFLKENGFPERFTVMAFGPSAATAMSWMESNPGKIAVFYGDDADLDFKSPADLGPMAKAGMAAILVTGPKGAGGSATENTDKFESAYKNYNGTIVVIHRTNADPKSYGLPNPEPILNFIYAHNQ